MDIAKSVVSFIKRQPKDFAILLALLFFLITTVIFWLRLNGQKIDLPFLDQYIKVVPEGSPNTVTTDQLNKYSQIVGHYKYKCKSLPKNHGGICHIEIITTDNGLQWKLEGERMWEELKDSSGTITKKHKLDISYRWETTWGDFINDNKIAFRYDITKIDKHIKGYAEGTSLSTPGINEIIQQWFAFELSHDSELAKVQNRLNIMPLTMIDLDTLILFQDEFKKGALRLEELIPRFWQYKQDLMMKGAQQKGFQGIYNSNLSFGAFIRIIGKNV